MQEKRYFVCSDLHGQYDLWKQIKEYLGENDENAQPLFIYKDEEYSLDELKEIENGKFSNLEYDGIKFTYTFNPLKTSLNSLAQSNVSLTSRNITYSIVTLLLIIIPCFVANKLFNSKEL